MPLARLLFGGVKSTTPSSAITIGQSVTVMSLRRTLSVAASLAVTTAADVVYSIRYTERLGEAGIEPSVGSKGDSCDNALAETINGLYKAELIHRRAPWKTKESVEFVTLEWVSWFNHHQLLEPIGYIPPAEAEANYFRQLAIHAAAVAS